MQATTLTALNLAIGGRCSTICEAIRRVFCTACFVYESSYTKTALGSFPQKSRLYPLRLAARSLLEHNSNSAHSAFVFSMASYKRRAFNHHLLERFIDKLDLEPTLIKSHPNYSTLYDYGAIAA